MPPKSTFKWTDALERKFLLAIIQKEGIAVSARYCDEIVYMMGIDTTGNAARQKFDKMKKEVLDGSEPGTAPVKKINGDGEGDGEEGKATGKRKALAKKSAAAAAGALDGESQRKKVKMEREESPDLA